MNRKQQLEILGRPQNKIEFYIGAKLKNADNWYNKGEKDKAKECYLEAVNLWNENKNEVHDHFLKCIIHLESKHNPRKTYGCEYDNKCYKIENKILESQELVWQD